MADRAVGALLIGGGPASAACAEALREGGFAGDVLLVGREFDPPYERPLCSKSHLAGASDRDAAVLHDSAWYAKRSIELATGVSVMRLDTAARTATLSTKEVVEYGVALVATGANVRRLRVEGAGLGGIHYLRTLPTADTLRADVAEAERVVLIGGSYVACEVAATLTALGKRCTLVMLEDAPLSETFGSAAGAFFGALLRDHGVELVCGDGLERFEGADERVERVITASGRAVDADLVVMGTGAMPDVMLARAAKLTLGETGGVACSADLETSARGVFAAGDMCEYDSSLHGGRARIEHYEVAVAQGKAAAAAMLGVRRPFCEVPYFWTDLADWATAEWVGVRAGPVQVVRGNVADGAFSVLHVAEGRVVGALSVGRGEDLAAARRLIAERVDVSARVGDLGVADLEAL